MENLNNILSEVIVKALKAQKASKEAAKLAEKLADAITPEMLAALTVYINALGIDKRSLAAGKAVYEEDGVKYEWCNRHQMYHPAEFMRHDTEGRNKGYCRPSESIWQMWYNRSKTYDKEVTKFVTIGALEKAQEQAKKAKDALAKTKDPSSYNYEDDFKNWIESKTGIKSGLALPKDLQ